VPASSAPAQDVASTAELRSGQELIYGGRFGAAQVFFSRLVEERPADPAGPALEASALIWWAEAREDDAFQGRVIDSLLGVAISRAQAVLGRADSDSARVRSLFWLGTALGYRARQAELRGSYWRAARDAKAMQDALEQALAADSSCVDCLLGLGISDYALARAGFVARIVARLLGLGSGDAERALGRMRRVGEEGTLARNEARWVYAVALLREGARGEAAMREEGLKIVGELAQQFPENPVFARALTADSGSP